MHTQIIQKATQAQLLQWDFPEADIQHLAWDSRKISTSLEGTLFIAIKGERHDGHDFIKKAYEAGVRNFLVERAEVPDLSSANIFLVRNSLQALQEIAQVHRESFSYPVWAITGSNGKTIVKEWLHFLLSARYVLVRSPRSYNSQLGVPLSVWEMEKWHEMALFEAGISKPGEMARLQKVIQPELGIFTNIGSAHDEGFLTRQEKVREKLRLFEQAKVIVYSRDNPSLDKEILQFAQDRELELFHWSEDETLESVLRILPSQGLEKRIDFEYQGQAYSLQIPFVDKASRQNAIHCLAALLYLKWPPAEFIPLFARLPPVKMRLELKKGNGDFYLIDDSYNNDLGGLRIALDYWQAQVQMPRKIAILSDVLESGRSPKDVYKEVHSLLEQKHVDVLYAIGENMRKYLPTSGLTVGFFSDTHSFLQQLNQEVLRNAMVLVKGGRKFAFEKIIQKLEEQSHTTVLEINLDALVHNLNVFRSLLKPATKLLVMVKAFAYGNGSAEIAGLLAYHRVDYLGVAYPDEGVALRQNGIKLPILVLNPEPGTYDKLIQYDLEPELYSFQKLEEYRQFVKRHALHSPSKVYPVHLKLDTGMHRLGFVPQDLPRLLKYLEAESLYPLKLISVFSHLAAADGEEHDAFTQNQIACYEEMTQKIEKVLGYSFIKHILNSPGITRFPEAQFDMVRLGVGLYGVQTPEGALPQLRPISTLKTQISQIKNLKAGDSVGYSRQGTIHDKRVIAIMAIGYADGFPRALGQGVGEVLVYPRNYPEEGVRVPVMGNVCMDMTMIDITGMELEEGDDVIIFNEQLSLEEMAKSLHTIPYEILTNISTRIRRIFYTE